MSNQFPSVPADLADEVYRKVWNVRNDREQPHDVFRWLLEKFEEQITLARHSENNNNSHQ